MERADTEAHAKIREYAEIYGGDIERWPEDKARVARTLIQDDPSIHAILEQEAELDLLLDKVREDTAPSDNLFERMRKRIEEDFERIQAERVLTPDQNDALIAATTPTSLSQALGQIGQALNDALEDAVRALGGRTAFTAGMGAAVIAGLMVSPLSGLGSAQTAPLLTDLFGDAGAADWLAIGTR